MNIPKCLKNANLLQKQQTNMCYANALNEVTGSSKKEVDMSDEVMAKVDELYLKKICKLNTEVLHVVLLCYERGLCSRARRTISAIENELAERVLLTPQN